MENKINIAKLLKDCPKGMELYSPIYGLGKLTRVKDRIYVKFPKEHNEKCFKPDGKVSEDGEIMLFPKGKTTWEGFKRPFNDGDIIFTHANCLKVGLGNTWISIFQEKRNGGVATYVDMTEDGKDYYDYIDGDKGLLCMNEDIMCQRLATEEEKQKLFDAIKANGYKWNSETRTLEKLIESKEETEIKIDIPNGYEFFGIDDDNKIVLTKKQLQYPKTYEGCCKITRSDPDFYIDTHLYSDKLGALYKLLICRDAYWKLAGDWNPDFANHDEKFIIACYYGKIYTTIATNYNRVLVFPTKEMRDAFYENFKELIEQCKELL